MLITPIDEAFPVRMAEDIEIRLRLRPKGSDPRITMDLTALDMRPGEKALNIHGDHVFEMLVHALYFHFRNENEAGLACCVEHYSDEIVKLLEKIDDNEDSPTRRVEH